nr:hypothetical protein Ade03nite_61900 [Actinoplanes derwentensis]
MAANLVVQALVLGILRAPESAYRKSWKAVETAARPTPGRGLLGALRVQGPCLIVLGRFRRRRRCTRRPLPAPTGCRRFRRSNTG